MSEGAGHSQYSMFIRWDRLDEIYIVSVPELPGCQTHGATYEEAAKRGEEAIESWIEAAITDGTDVPAPQTVTA